MLEVDENCFASETKVGFATKTCKKASFTAKYHDQWDTCNAIVLSWLMNTVAPSLLSGIVYLSDASLVWEDLQEQFDKVNRVSIYQLHREIATIAQETNVSYYFTKLKELWAESDIMVIFSSCECPKSKDDVEHLRQQRLIQFLGGLNESHSQARRQILMKTTKPTLNQAYAMIKNEESQKYDMDHNAMGMKTLIEENDVTSFLTAKQPSKPRYKNPNTFCDHSKSKVHMKVIVFSL